MKTITVPKRSKSINTLLVQAGQEQLILKNSEGRKFILVEINDDFDRELELIRQNSELMAFLEARAKSTQTVSLQEAKLQLGLSN